MEKPTAAGQVQAEANPAAAIWLVLAAVMLFSCLDTTAKYLVLNSGLPVGQVVWMRFLAQFLLMAILIPAFGLMGAREMYVTRVLGQQVARSVFMALTTVFNFLALRYLQLDQAITILFLAPLVVALLAGPVLGEWVGWRRLLAIFIGFAGVLIVVRPGLVGLNVGMVYSLLAMLALSVFILQTRQLAGRDPAIVTLFYSMFAGVLLGAPYTWAYGVWPSDTQTWLLVVLMGVFGGSGHYLFIQAYRLAPAGFLSSFLYLQIISSVTLGYLVFEDLPDVWTVLGSMVIVGSGLYLYYRERQIRAAVD